jgi:hypothetical protein
MGSIGEIIMRFKTQLGLHPAWNHSIQVPASLIKHYKELGLDNNQLVYVLQIIFAYWQGQEASHAEIAHLMGCTQRALRRYNNQLEKAGLVAISGRYLHGNRLENDYDLTPLLDASAMLDVSSQEQQQQAERNAYRIVSSLVTALEQGEDVSEILADLAANWHNKRLTKDEPTGTPVPIETGTPVPIETGTPVPIETGTPVPIETGTPVPISTGTPVPGPTREPTGTHVPIETGTPVPGVVVVTPNNNLLEETTTNNMVQELHEIGFANGDANKVIATALTHFGNEALDVLRGWVAYVSTQQSVRNPPGLIRARIREGERPPAIPATHPAPDAEVAEMREI